tara:strand:- start:3432 stop:4022 length:591 start_codon:yes stop_codon:yes gene_type:complete
MKKLQLTKEEVEQLTCGETFEDRIKIIHNDIPLPVAGEKWHSSMYIEDDGRQYRYIEFIDTETNKTHTFQYTYNQEIENSIDLEHIRKAGIEIVDVSVINPPKAEPIPEPKPLTEEEKAVKDLWSQYNAIKDELETFNKDNHNVPETVIRDIVLFLSTQYFNMNQLLLKVLPVCIEYKLEQKSFWLGIQKMRGIRK